MTDFAHYPSLHGLNAFVTGGATGIGAAIVSAYAAQGVRVGFVDINESAGTALSKRLEEQGAEVWFRAVDVTETRELQSTIKMFSESGGPVDLLVNNVANDTRHAWSDVTPEMWEKSLAVNLNPVFFAIQTVAAGMMERQRGSIINFGSISWKAKHGGMPAYTTAKAAIHGLTRSFVREFGAHGVRINTVLPGWVLTDRQLTEHFGDDGKSILDQNQPLRGTISERDVAALVMFLSADDSSMCTGQEFTLDGGWI